MIIRIYQESFDNENNVQIFKKGQFPNKYHYSNSDSPDYLIVANLGWSLTTTQKLNQGKSFPGGMHGYDPNYLEMHGIFLQMALLLKAVLELVLLKILIFIQLFVKHWAFHHIRRIFTGMIIY